MWKTVELQEIIEGLYDGPHATPKESDSGAIFLGIKNVSEDGRLDLSEIRYIALDDMVRWTKRVTPKHKDIVFSYEATLHRYARIPENFVGCLGRRMALVRVEETKCNGDFLFSYFLSSVWRKEVEKYILPGATVDRIPLTTVPNFKLTIPSLPIQKKIAGVLSAYDDLIEANLKRIKLLEEMAQITYEEWFVRLRFPNHETTPINPETGLPEGWAERQLDTIGFVNRETISARNTPSSINYIDISSADHGFYAPPQEMNFKDAPSRARRVVKFGDTIFSTVRPNRRVYSLILEHNPLLVASTGFAVVTPNQPYNFPFIYLSIDQQSFTEKAVAVAGGAAYPAINQSDFERIKIIVPTEKLMK